MQDYRIAQVKCDGCHKRSTDSAESFKYEWLSVDVDGVFYNLCPECIEARTNLRSILGRKESNDGISKGIDDN